MATKGTKQYQIKRRDLVGCICALGVGLPQINLAQAQDEAALLAPQVDDLIAFAYGDQAGQAIALDALQPEAKQIFAYAMDPTTGLLRNGTRMNQLLIIRLNPAELTEATAQLSVNGLVAYSGVCSHTGCDVTDWNAESKRFQCPCHESQFDPADGARVVGGPAPWQLAALPLKALDGKLAVAGQFQGRLGFQQPGLSPFGI